ncbi:MAG: glycosyltransferase family A protein [Planctomycetota bacterium]
MQKPAPIRVALFAHNEERTIARSLRHLMREFGPFDDAEVHVLMNGCTDRTAEVTTRIASKHAGKIVPHLLAIGDKAATWNAYLYEISPAHPTDAVQVFMDADIWPEPGSLGKMAIALAERPNASVIGGLPMCGRNRDRYRRLAMDKGLVYGGIYATRGSWLSWAREVGFRIPRGLIADDSVLTNAFTTLPNDLRRSDLKRVQHLPDCGYRFEPIRPWRWSDVRKYVNRQTRYRLGSEQLRVLGWRWPDEMPEDADGLNREVLSQLKATSKRTDWVAMRLLKQLEQRYDKQAA